MNHTLLAGVGGALLALIGFGITGGLVGIVAGLVGIGATMGLGLAAGIAIAIVLVGILTSAGGTLSIPIGLALGVTGLAAVSVRTTHHPWRLPVAVLGVSIPVAMLAAFASTALGYLTGTFVIGIVLLLIGYTIHRFDVVLFDRTEEYHGE